MLKLDLLEEKSDLCTEIHPETLCAGYDPVRFWYGKACEGCPCFTSKSTIAYTPLDMSYILDPNHPSIGCSVLLEKCGKYGYNRETDVSALSDQRFKEFRKRARSA